MKVTIVVPVYIYNAEPYIIRCFDSIKHQTYTNIECIFVDDCSTDKSGDIIKQQIAEYSGPISFKYIKNRENKGASTARNNGTKIATGQYIYYLDIDDEITDGCIETLINLVKKYPEAEIVQGNTMTIPKFNPSEDWLDLNYKNFPEYSSNHKWIKQRCLVEPRIPINVWNKLIKKELLFDNNLFFLEGVEPHEDDHWAFYAAKHIKHIAFSKEIGYIHYFLEGSVIRSGCNKKSLNSILAIVKDWNNNLDGFLLSAQKSTIYVLLRNTLLIVNKGGDEEIIRKYRSYIKQLLKSNFESLHFNYCIILLLMLMPKHLYNNVFTKKSVGLILKLS